MPSYDKTGPLGKGSRTGRGLGKCPITEKEFNKNWAKRFKNPFGKGVNCGIGCVAQKTNRRLY